MGEFTESYYLKAELRGVAVELVLRAKLHAYVFGPKRGWVQILVDGPRVVPNEQLLAANEGILLHYVFSEHYGACLEIYQRNEAVFRFGLGEEGQAVDQKTDRDVIRVGEILQLSAAQVADIQSLLAGKEPPLSRMSPAFTLATILGSGKLEWFDYSSFGRHSAIEQVGFDVVEVEPPSEHQILNKSQDVTSHIGNDTPTMFPKVLHGNAVAVRRRVRKLIRDVWTAGQWSNCAQLERVQFQHLSHKILIGTLPVAVPAGEELWRLNDIGEALYLAYRQSEEDGRKKGHSKYHRLLLDGMRSSLWFTIGLLDHDDLVQFKAPGSDCDYASVCRTILVEYVFWLPEICTIADHLVDSSQYLGTAGLTPSWAHNILHVALNAGWDFNMSTLERVYKGDFVRAMLDGGVIEKTQTGYQVPDSFSINNGNRVGRHNQNSG